MREQHKEVVSSLKELLLILIMKLWLGVFKSENIDLDGTVRIFSSFLAVPGRYVIFQRMPVTSTKMY